MEVFKNDKGENVYRLHSIPEIALLPEDEVEKALGCLHLLIYNIRLHVAAIAADNPDLSESEIFQMLNPETYVDWTVDNEISAAIKDPAGHGIRVRLSPTEPS